MSRPNFAPNLYTRFKLVRNQDGVRIIGAFNTGDWYEFAHLTAQNKGDGQGRWTAAGQRSTLDLQLGRHLCAQEDAGLPVVFDLGMLQRQASIGTRCLVACSRLGPLQ